MSAARSADWAVIDIDRDAVRLLIGRPRAGTGSVPRTGRARPLDVAPAGSASAGRARTGRRAAARPPVRHLDTRVRPLLPDDVGTASVEARAVETLDAVTRYLRLADRAGATPLLVARQELRRTPEGAAALSLLASELPDPVRVLSARRELELAFDAVVPALEPVDTQLVVFLKPSGTDVAIASGSALADNCTLPLGIASLAAALPDPPTPLEWALEATKLGGLLTAIPRSGVLRAVVSGDGADALAGFEAIRGEKRVATLTIADLDRLSDEVLRGSSRKIARRTGDDPRRVVLLAPGALILASILSRYGLSKCTLVPQGLRDGVAMAAAADPDGWWLDDREVPAPAAFDGVAADG